MFRRKEPESAHHRYIFVDEFEKDRGFRDYLARLCRIGLRNAGIIGIATPAIHFIIFVLLTGKEISFVQRGGIEYSIADKLVIFAMGLVGLLLSRIILRPQYSRALISLILLVVCLGIIYDDVLKGDVSLTAGYLILVMLVGVSVVPYRPWQVFLLGLGIMLLFYLSIRFIPPMIAHFVLLTLATLVCTAVTIILYISRYLMYRSRQKETALRQAIT